MAWVTRLFPLWALMIVVLGAVFSPEFVKFQPAIVPLLGLVMFGMGMTLTAKHFAMVLQRPWIVMLGVTLQFVLMPLIAWLLSTALDLSADRSWIDLGWVISWWYRIECDLLSC